MKKYLLLLILVMLTVCITNAQPIQGYHWSFGSAPPFNSVPAITGSAGSHTLTLLGDEELGITVASATDLTLGSCAGPINVGAFHQPRVPAAFVFGLQFDNNPQFVTNVYTIEMTVKFNPTTNKVRILGFTDLEPVPADPSSDNGIYIDALDATLPIGNLFFYNGATHYRTSPFIANTWYHLVFVRDANNIISYYKNGAFVATFDDSGNNFLPMASNGNVINFLKDDGFGGSFEEDAGSIAKLSIYNRVLTGSEIAKKTFNNLCNTSFQLPVTPDEGHQWKFPASTPPFVSVPALAQSPGNYTLAILTGPGGSITSGDNANVNIGTSCAGGPGGDVAAFTKSVGLEFDNSPRYVYDTYTIELTINFAQGDNGTIRRLVGFYSSSDYGIYVTASGLIAFYNGINNVLTTSPSIAGSNTDWYHLVFTRAANKVISFYLNGVLSDTYTDNLDEFLPHSSNLNQISFLKDEATEETSGRLAKIGIFNIPLSSDDVIERYNNICNTALVVLPVSLKSFTAVKADNQAELTWTTSSEQNNLGFEVQRSSDGINFTAIGFVNGNGTTTQEHTYQFTDQSPSAGKNYYRLKQIDIDNRATYSSIRSIEMDKDQQRIQLFPNPSRSLITITNIKAGNQMSVFNSQGNLILRKIASSGQESISVEKFAAGVYMLQVTDSDNNKRTIRFSRF